MCVIWTHVYSAPAQIALLSFLKEVRNLIEITEDLLLRSKWQKSSVYNGAQYILGKCDREEAVKALIEALNDDETVLRREAADSLGQIARRSPETKGLADAFENLITFINTGDREMRLACARTLGTLNNPAAIPALFASLQDDEASVRTQAIQSLTALISEITPRATLIVRHKFFGYQVHSQKYNGYSFRNGYF